MVTRASQAEESFVHELVSRIDKQLPPDPNDQLDRHFSKCSGYDVLADTLADPLFNDLIGTHVRVSDSAIRHRVSNIYQPLGRTGRRLGEDAVALIQLSPFRIDTVLQNLLSELQRFVNQSKSDDIAVLNRVSDSQCFLLFVTHLILYEHWYQKNIRDTAPPATNGTDSTSELIPAPPAVSLQAKPADALAVMAIDIIADTFRQMNPRYPLQGKKRLTKVAGLVIQQLGFSNFDAIFNRLCESINALKRGIDLGDLTLLTLMEYLRVDIERLSMLLAALGTSASSYKKKVLKSMALPLRRLIFKWMNESPDELSALYNAYPQCCENGADGLFEAVFPWADSGSASRKYLLWPLLLMLLMLMPRHLQNIDHANVNKKDKRALFLVKRLEKNFKKKTMMDICSRCYVDLLKVIAIFSRETGLHGHPPTVLTDILREADPLLPSLIVNPQNPFLTSEGGIDSSMLVDFLESSLYRASHHTVNNLLPQCLTPSAPISFKLALINLLLHVVATLRERGEHEPEKSQQVIHNINEALLEAYATVATPLRDIFHELVHVYTQPRTKELVALAAEKAQSSIDKKTKLYLDRVRDEREFQLRLIQLFRADPRLLLIRTSDQAHDSSSNIYTSAVASASSSSFFSSNNNNDSQLNSRHSPGVKNKNMPKINRVLVDTCRVFEDLCRCLLDHSTEVSDQIRHEAASTLLELHAPMWVVHWWPEHVNTGFWQISSAVVGCVSDMLLDETSLGSNALWLLSQLGDILVQGNNFLQEQRDGTAERESGERPSTYKNFSKSIGKLEAALLVQLCSCDPAVCAKSAELLGLLCDQVDLLADIELKGHAIAANYSVYRAMPESGKLVTGRAAQQKAVRKLLREVQAQTVGNIQAWGVVFARWRKNKQTVLNKAMDAEDVMLMEWQNHTGFLCALGGVTLGKLPQSGVPNANNAIELRIPDEELATIPWVVRGEALVDDLLSELLELVSCFNSYVRDTVLSSLGTNLSPACYSYLFTKLHSAVGTIYGDVGQVNVRQATTVFVGQAIAIVKQILEQPQESADHLALADFETLVLSFVEYSAHLPPQDEETLKIRRRLCLLVELLMSRRDWITFSSETKFRNRLFYRFTEWMSDLSGNDVLTGSTGSSRPVSLNMDYNVDLLSERDKMPPSLTVTNPLVSASFIGSKESLRHIHKMWKDLDRACMAAIQLLVHNLGLEETSMMDKTKTSGTKAADIIPVEDALSRKQRLFYRYFCFLSDVLDRCRQKPETADPQLYDLTIGALGNLLRGNIDVGFSYFMTMGYHEDPDTRSHCLRVLTLILRSGTEFDALREPPSKYEELLELVLEPDMRLVNALLQVTQPSDADDLATCLVNVVESVSELNLLQMFYFAIHREIQITVSVGTMFRSNSMPTRMLHVYTKRVGQDYLRSVLSPLISWVIEQQVNCELDHSRLKENEDRTKNLENLRNMATYFLESIFQSLNQCPKTFRQICHYLAEQAASKFGPESSHAAIGGFIFLRFFCPAIVAPESQGLLEHTPADSDRRALLLITKTMQNLANGSRFKEEYMAEMNDFLEQNKSKVHTFFTALATTEDVPETVMHESTHHAIGEAARDSEDSLAIIHSFLVANVDQISQLMATPSAPVVVAPEPSQLKGDSTQEPGHPTDPTASTTGARSFDRLAVVLARLGPPAELYLNKKIEVRPQAGRDAPAPNILFEDYMRRNQHRDTSGIKEKGIFYRHGESLAKQPVFYYIARKYDSGMNLDSLLYYILDQLQPHFRKPISIVFDCTNMTQEHLLPLSWCKKMWMLLPEAVLKNLAALYILHPNLVFKQLAKKVRKILTDKLIKRIQLVSSPSALSSYISTNEIRLPEETWAVQKEVEVTFSQVTLLWTYTLQKELVLHLSSNYLQLVFPGDSVMSQTVDRTELIRMDRIASAELVEKDSTNTMLTLQYKDTTGRLASIVLTSPAAQQIIRTVRMFKVRYEQSEAGNRSQTQMSRTGTFKPSDVPGALLNMALINLGSKEEGARRAAYNLLAQLRGTFGFTAAGLPMVEGDEVTVPRLSGPSVVAMSRALATSEPHLTMEFLREALQGFRMRRLPNHLRHMCLEYMSPWLPNTSLLLLGKILDKRKMQDASSELPSVRSRLEEFLSDLIDATMEFDEFYHQFMARIWATIAADDIGPVEMAVDLFIKRMVDAAEGAFNVDNTVSANADKRSAVVDVMVDLLVAMSASKSRLIGDRINNLLNQVLDDAVKDPTWPVLSGSLWSKLTVLARAALMLSFGNTNMMEYHLPKVLHFVVLLFSTGTLYMRSLVQSFIINMVHCMCTFPGLNAAESNKLAYLEKDLNSPKFRLIFLGTSSNASSQREPHDNEDFKSTLPTKKDLEEVPIGHVEQVVTLLLEALSCCYSIAAMPAVRWQREWLCMAEATAFHTEQPLIASRAFTTLGLLTKSFTLLSAQVEDRTIVQVLTCLQRALGADQWDLAVSITQCLARLVPGCPPTSPLVKPLFWIAVAMLQIGEVKLFAAAANLLEVVLKCLQLWNYFGADGISTVLLDARKHSSLFSDLSSQLDEETGLSFKRSFSYALAGNVIKGLTYPTRSNERSTQGMRTVTFRLLRTFLEIASQAQDTETLGYVAGMLPVVAADNLSSLRRQGVCCGSDNLTAISTVMGLPDLFTTKFYFKDSRSVILFTSLLLTFLQNTHTEQEQLAIYNLIRDVIRQLPCTFQEVYGMLLPKLKHAFSTSQSHDILDAVLALLQTVMADTASIQVKDFDAHLKGLGFDGLATAGSFVSVTLSRKNVCKRYAKDLINAAFEILQYSAPNS